jgi:drug/metabolite transporter (DMT)-like permease
MTLPSPAARTAQVVFAGGAIIGAPRGRTIVTLTKDLPMSKPTTSEYVRGSLYGIAAVSIWASWIVAVRLGIRTSLAPWVAGLILLPYLRKKGLAVDRLGWAGLAAIIMGGGAPMVLVSYGGLLFAPAAHAASLYTALIPLYVAIVAAVVLGEAFTVARRIGLALIITGVLGIVWGAGGTLGSRQNIGHALFIGAGMLWACYVVAMRKATLRDLALQAFVHGFLVAVISFVCIGRAVSILGASNGSAFAALAPAITAILAIPILGEWPATSDWIAMLLISSGVYVASGGLLMARRVERGVAS